MIQTMKTIINQMINKNYIGNILSAVANRIRK